MNEQGGIKLKFNVSWKKDLKIIFRDFEYKKDDFLSDELKCLVKKQSNKSEQRKIIKKYVKNFYNELLF
jgi:hypothetical protein